MRNLALLLLVSMPFLPLLQAQPVYVPPKLIDDYEEARIPASVMDIELLRQEMEINEILKSASSESADPIHRVLSLVDFVALNKRTQPKSILVQIGLKNVFFGKEDVDKVRITNIVLNFIAETLKLGISDKIQRSHFQGRIMVFDKDGHLSKYAFIKDGQVGVIE